jgi:hypothetical protein
MASFVLFILVVGLLACISRVSSSLALFKLFTFLIGVLTVTFAFSHSAVRIAYFKSWFFTIYSLIVFLSVPMLATSAGYYPGTDYFLGILSHSQAFGTFVAPFTAWLLILWLTGDATTIFTKIVTTIGMALLILSASRTGVLAFVGAIFLVYLIGMFRSGDDRRRLHHAVPLGIGVLLIMISADYVSGGILSGKIIHFLVKSHAAASFNTIAATRADKVSDAWQTFNTAPLAGVGFGMPMSTNKLIINRDPILGLPLSAPVEASVMYAALPAQIGILGLIPFLLFAGAFFLPMIRKAPLAECALVLCGLVINMGEYIFFATGGLGLLLWLYFAFAYRSYTDTVK